MWYLFLILAIVIVLLIVLLIIFLKYKHNYWKYLDIPHDEPKQWNVIIQEMLGKIPNDYASKTQRYEQLYRSFKGTGPFCGFHVQLDPFVLVLERELVQRILIKDFSNFNDRGLYHNSKKDPLSSDLYCITANEWKEMRIKLDPIFRPEIIKALHNSSFNAEGQAHLLNAFDVALLNQPRVGINFVDVRPLVRRYVLASIAKNVFGLDVNLQARFPLNEFDEMTQLALNTKRHGKILNIFMQKYTNLGQKMGLTYTNKKAEKYFMNLIESVVEEREKKSPSYTNPDFLQLLIDIKTQEASTHISMTGRSNVDENKTLKDHLIKELAAHAFVFLREGLEPTTHAINCVLYELAEHQIYQHQVRAEVLDAVTRHGGELSYECLQEFKTLHKIILGKILIELLSYLRSIFHLKLIYAFIRKIFNNWNIFVDNRS